MEGKVRTIDRLRLTLGEGSLVSECVGVVLRRGLDGPAGKGRYWVVGVKVDVYYPKLPATEHLIITACGRDGRMEVLEEEEMFRAVDIQVMQDRKNRALELKAFTFSRVLDFTRGIAHVID